MLLAALSLAQELVAELGFNLPASALIKVFDL